MEHQNRIARSLRGNMDRVRAVLAQDSSSSRSSAADAVCEAFGFRDGRGRLQRASCRKELVALAASGQIVLPGARRSGGGVRVPRCLAEAVPAPAGVPDTVGAVAGLRLVLVADRAQAAIWNTLMAHEHPRGAGPFVGHQLRYLVGSDHGWLGAVGFAASARRLACRDRWIGWDDATRGARLHRVLGLSRFLVRPSVSCRHLASRVLGRVVRMVGDDFEREHGFRPCLLETFVESESHAGTSFRAANWIAVGETAGRGRQDRANAAGETRKAVYLYALEPDWQQQLRAAPPRIAPLAAGEGLDAEHWAEQEFGGAPLGDARLGARLVACARHQAAAPQSAFTVAARGNRALIKGHYRLIDKPDAQAVTAAKIMHPHREQTLRRMQDEETVLCIQDTTALNFSRLGQTGGLGSIGTNQTGAEARGLHLHATLAVNPAGLPLGILHAKFTARPLKAEREAARKEPRKRTPEEKESFRWIEGLRDCAEAAARLDGVRVVSVMDREADFLDLFLAQRASTPQVELLVRARSDRVVGSDPSAGGTGSSGRLFGQVRSSPERGRLTLEVKRRSARAKAGKQARKALRPARTATVALRWMKAGLPVRDQPPVAMNIVHVREEDPPADAPRLEWFLLTTLPVNTADDAERILEWYALRWRLEDWFRILKNGCRVEDLRNGTAERLQRAAAINMVIAWRIHLMTRLGREVPEMPPGILFSGAELRVPAVFARSRRKPPRQTLSC